jgi:hypothetical protein
MMVRRRKPRVKVQVTGRAIAYIQPVARNGKLGKAKPVVITTTRVGRKK